MAPHKKVVFKWLGKFEHLIILNSEFIGFTRVTKFSYKKCVSCAPDTRAMAWRPLGSYFHPMAVKLILTSAAASDVTSIRFTARKANTAAASTGKECTLFQLLASSTARTHMLCPQPPQKAEGACRAAVPLPSAFRRHRNWDIYSREQRLATSQSESHSLGEGKLGGLKMSFINKRLPSHQQLAP